jgi:hypothetical protein
VTASLRESVQQYCDVYKASRTLVHYKHKLLCEEVRKRSFEVNSSILTRFIILLWYAVRCVLYVQVLGNELAEYKRVFIPSAAFYGKGIIRR